LALAQWFYVKISGRQAVENIPAAQSILSGLVCWLLLGGMIGIGAVLNKGTQLHKGLLGGLIGAVLGGLIYEMARVQYAEKMGSLPGKVKSLPVIAISLGLLGGAIGASVALITTAAKNAWVEVTNGKLKGRIYDITKYVDAKMGSRAAGLIGSDANAAWIYLPGDIHVLPRHAEIRYANGAPTLTVVDGNKKTNRLTLINGRNVAASMPLSNGDRVQIGKTTLVYHQKGR
jgi:hypothetical protein